MKCLIDNVPKIKVYAITSKNMQLKHSAEN